MAVDVSPEQRIKELERKVADLEEELTEAQEATTVAEEHAADAEDRITAVSQQAGMDIDRCEGIVSSLRRHVWRDDRPGPTYCVSCGHGWPVHQHDCPFGDVA